MKNTKGGGSTPPRTPSYQKAIENAEVSKEEEHAYTTGDRKRMRRTVPLRIRPPVSRRGAEIAEEHRRREARAGPMKITRSMNGDPKHSAKDAERT